MSSFIRSKSKNNICHNRPTQWIIVLIATITVSMLVGLTTYPASAKNSTIKHHTSTIKSPKLCTVTPPAISKTNPVSDAKTMPYNPKLKKFASNLPYYPKSNKDKPRMLSESAMQQPSSAYEISPDISIEPSAK